MGAVLFQFPHWFIPSPPNREYLKSLAESWRQQPGTPVYNRDLDAAQVRDALHRA